MGLELGIKIIQIIMNETITVETHVKAPLEKVWADFTSPEAVMVWNAASPDWHTTRAENDLQVGAEFSYRMEAKDGSEGFDMGGVYTDIIEHQVIAYVMNDGRSVRVTFLPDETGVRVIETFDPESEHAPEFQRAGWQSILDNFKQYVER